MKQDSKHKYLVKVKAVTMSLAFDINVNSTKRILLHKFLNYRLVSVYNVDTLLLLSLITQMVILSSVVIMEVVNALLLQIHSAFISDVTESFWSEELNYVRSSWL